MLLPSASRALVSSQRRGARFAQRTLSVALVKNNLLSMRTTPLPPPSVFEDKGERKVEWSQMTTFGNSLTDIQGKGSMMNKYTIYILRKRVYLVVSNVILKCRPNSQMKQNRLNRTRPVLRLYRCHCEPGVWFSIYNSIRMCGLSSRFTTRRCTNCRFSWKLETSYYAENNVSSVQNNVSRWRLYLVCVKYKMWPK